MKRKKKLDYIFEREKIDLLSSTYTHTRTPTTHTVEYQSATEGFRRKENFCSRLGTRFNWAKTTYTHIHIEQVICHFVYLKNNT